MKHVAIATIASALIAAAPAAAQNFDGASVGVQAGWSQTDLRNPTTDLGALPIEDKQDSAVIGAFTAYDKEFGHFVLGAELGFTIGTDDAINTTVGPQGYRIDPRRSIDATLRGGYLLSPTTLLYARTGYVNDRVRTTIAGGSPPTVQSENKDGWTVGGGLEHIIMPHLSARVEYRYADLSEGDGKWDRHQVLTGLAWRF